MVARAASQGVSTMPRRAYSYIRFSFWSQKDGDSYRRQTSWAEQKAADMGLCLDDTLRMEDLGRSAFRGKNADVGALGAFMLAVERGRVAPGSVLLVENLDRLSRDHVDDAFELFRRIIKAGVTIVTRDPAREYSLDGVRDNMLALLEPLFIFARAHEESALKSMRVRAAWGEKKRLARGKVPHGRHGPAWVYLDSQGYHLDVDRARTLRAICRMAREGLGIYRITGRLGADPEQFPPFGPSGRWSVAYVRKILRGRMALGEYQPTRITAEGKRVPDGDPVPGYYPPALSEEEWAGAQLAITGRRRSMGRPGRCESNLFTGIVCEAHTGAPLSIQPSVPKHGRRNAYLFTGRAGATFVRYDDVEAAVVSALDELTAADVVDDPARRTTWRRRSPS
jgi:DNA invertase Pin-like site-specific DNA recombinase